MYLSDVIQDLRSTEYTIERSGFYSLTSTSRTCSDHDKGGPWIEPAFGKKKFAAAQVAVHQPRRLQWACCTATLASLPQEQMSSPAISSWLFFEGDCGGGTCRHQSPQKALHTFVCVPYEKSLLRRSLSGNLLISVLPEDQQCRLPGPSATTQRFHMSRLCWKCKCVDQLGQRSRRLALACSETRALWSVLHHRPDCAG